MQSEDSLNERLQSSRDGRDYTGCKPWEAVVRSRRANSLDIFLRHSCHRLPRSQSPPTARHLGKSPFFVFVRLLLPGVAARTIPYFFAFFSSSFFCDFGIIFSGLYLRGAVGKIPNLPRIHPTRSDG
jgi:hypothetical protein